MNRLVHWPPKISSYIIVASAYVLYVIGFAAYHDNTQVGISSLAVIPVIGGSWYFGVRGILIVSLLHIPTNMFLRLLQATPTIVFGAY
jgi:hypothetical protein